MDSPITMPIINLAALRYCKLYIAKINPMMSQANPANILCFRGGVGKRCTLINRYVVAVAHTTTAIINNIIIRSHRP